MPTLLFPLLFPSYRKKTPNPKPQTQIPPKFNLFLPPTSTHTPPPHPTLIASESCPYLPYLTSPHLTSSAILFIFFFFLKRIFPQPSSTALPSISLFRSSLATLVCLLDPYRAVASPWQPSRRNLAPHSPTGPITYSAPALSLSSIR